MKISRPLTLTLAFGLTTRTQRDMKGTGKMQMQSLTAILASLTIAGMSTEALAASATPQAGRQVNHMPVGGGSTQVGFDGEYFANLDFNGEPAFTRRDPRIHFD